MKREYQEFFCEEVRQLWLSLPFDRRPEIIWIRLHAPILAPDYNLHTDVLGAWVLDSGAIAARSASAYMRFYSTHAATPPWHCGTRPIPSGIFRQAIHEIGLAGFAEVAGSDEFYFEWQFGGTFGRGSTYTRNESGILQISQNVFIS